MSAVSAPLDSVEGRKPNTATRDEASLVVEKTSSAALAVVGFRAWSDVTCTSASEDHHICSDPLTIFTSNRPNPESEIPNFPLVKVESSVPLVGVVVPML